MFDAPKIRMGYRLKNYNNRPILSHFHVTDRQTELLYHYRASVC